MTLAAHWRPMKLALILAASALALAACDDRLPPSQDAPGAPSADEQPGTPAPERPGTPEAPAPEPSAPPRHVDASATQCVQGETHLYSCPMANGRIVSVCVGNRRVSYRYGPVGEPEIDITVPQGQAGVWQTQVRGQGGGHQTHIRFVRGGYDYIVLSGADGSLADNPGRTYSGVVVMRGSRVVNDLDCPVISSQTEIPFSMIPDYIPFEEEGGDYDAWF